MSLRRFPIALFLTVLFFAFPALPLSAFSGVIGIIEYIEGEVTLTRSGVVQHDPEMGDSIENFDFVKTGSNGQVVIALNASTGMAGTIAIKPKSVCSIKTESVKGVSSTEADMIAGAVCVKAKKIAGSPSLRVRTSATTMGVRGTEFEVIVSINDSLLVACSDGIVSCTGAEGDELEAIPGQSVLKNAGERLRRVPIAVTQLEQFKNDWLAEELGVFRAAPLRAIDQYAIQYRRSKGEFRRAFTPMAGDEGLAEWADQYRRGVTPRSNDVRVMRQKSAVVPKLMAVRRVLFLFERVYYRLNEVREQVGSETLKARLPSGGTVDEFFKELAVDKSEMEQKAAMFRFALKLYAERNEGRDAVSLGDASDDDFFEDADSFFKD